MKMTIESTAAKRGRFTKNFEKFMGGVRGGGKEGASSAVERSLSPASKGPKRAVSGKA
jgi:hypothetical protein